MVWRDAVTDGLARYWHRLEGTPLLLREAIEFGVKYYRHTLPTVEFLGWRANRTGYAFGRGKCGAREGA